MEVKIIEERALTMSETKEKLQSLKKRDKELNFRANKVNEYLDGFPDLKDKKLKEIIEKINGLNIGRIRDKHIAKIIDLMPDNIDILKAIFSGENITLKQEDLAKILEVIR